MVEPFLRTLLDEVARPHRNLVCLHGSREFPHARDAMKYILSLVDAGEKPNSASCLRGAITLGNSMNMNVSSR
ncbi:hypothetical protein E2C01_028518 [Portunus trituberculatus]|uniref:Uncharacterized protein n=1 Tax=Portunus trituberculatus TaxID=210409 RepID=A0A5B7ERW7_PORTR|nr:hypothetical protein [Portunus trituberculatus]